MIDLEEQSEKEVRTLAASGDHLKVFEMLK